MTSSLINLWMQNERSTASDGGWPMAVCGHASLPIVEDCLHRKRKSPSIKVTRKRKNRPIKREQTLRLWARLVELVFLSARFFIMLVVSFSAAYARNTRWAMGLRVWIIVPIQAVQIRSVLAIHKSNAPCPKNTFRRLRPSRRFVTQPGDRESSWQLLNQLHQLIT